jgi:hypothetical protein
MQIICMTWNLFLASIEEKKAILLLKNYRRPKFGRRVRSECF